MAHTLNAITISGNILSNEFIHTSTVAGGKLPAFDPSTFDPHWTKDAEFEAAVSTAYEEIKERFDALGTELQYLDVASIRRQWHLPILKLLGFSPVYQRTHLRLANVNETFPISHRGWDGPGAPAVHLLSFQDDLDHKPAGRGAKSPHGVVQSYLNQDTSQHWAIISNGHVFRLLRDYFHTSQPGYVQFDLLQMFLTRDFNEFRSFYRLVHASRFKPRGNAVEPARAGTLFDAPDPDPDEEPDAAEVAEKPLPVWLEVYYSHSRSEGSRAEENLRKNVQEALDVLGNGLLTAELRAELLAHPERLEPYYRQLLRIVYRSIFLLFAEQRGLVPNPAPYAEVYRSEYSLTALRDLSAQQRFVRDEGHDLWERLLLTFDVARIGNDELGVPAFNGNLFDAANVDMIYGSEYDPARRNDETLALPKLSNEQTLKFIECLAFTQVNGVYERINYRDIKVEEIGHIYESLLDYAPRIAEGNLLLGTQQVTSGMFFLDDRGMSRKSSGSYYTPRELVQEVISRSLLPVLEDRLEGAGDELKAQEAAIFSINVLDLACGSGAFLIAANDALAQRLAELRWQAKAGSRSENADAKATSEAEDLFDTPTKRETFTDELQTARRDVLTHCIYGVDLNEMAVELAKVALWINAASAGQPLNFLDHRVRHGNSLVGAPLNFIQLGIDPDAYKGRGDADPDTLKEVRKGFTKRQLEQHRTRMQGQLFDLSVELPDLDNIEEHTAQDVDRKAELYRDFRSRDAYRKWELIADYWTSAFFYPVQPDLGAIPSQRGLTQLLQEIAKSDLTNILRANHGGHWLDTIEALKNQYHFFHYWLEFPEVFFEPNGGVRDGGGFDVIVGNPPWERVKLQEKEFFSTRDINIANAANASKRKKLIAALEIDNPPLYTAFQDALVGADATSNFLRVSGRYPLGGVGDVNTYQVFTENARDLTGKAGRTGIIVPSGIATDNTTKDLFRDFVENQSLVSLDDFENREGIFLSVHRSYKFCLLTLTAPGSGPEQAQFSFFNTNISHLKDPARWFTLSFDNFKRINPNTLTCPTFRTGRDAEITLKMYERAGVFIDENDEKNGNPWGASFMTMFHMSNDSSLFRTKEELEAQGFALRGNRFVGAGETYVPLYEGRMIHLFNHRPVGIGKSEGLYRSASSIESKEEDLKIAEFAPLPRYWVIKTETDNHLTRFDKAGNPTWSWQANWILAFKDITSSTNARTAIFSFAPRVGAGHTLPLVFTAMPLKQNMALLSNVNSLVLDYVARQKVGGLHLTYFYIMQFPILPPNLIGNKHLETVCRDVLELTYTSWDIKPFADDLWQEADEELRDLLRVQWQANAAASGGGHPFEPPDWAENAHEGCPLAPFTWNEDRRTELRAELDALYAHLYGLTSEELEWILDPRDVDPTTPSLTFPGLRRNDEKRFGEYRTKLLVLHYYDQQAAASTGSMVAERV